MIINRNHLALDYCSDLNSSYSGEDVNGRFNALHVQHSSLHVG